MSTDSVCVACKIPGGLELKVCRMVSKTMPSPGGMREERISEQVGRAYVVGGPRLYRGADLAIHGAPVILDEGFVLTPGVPLDFWEEWLRQHAEQPYVRNKLIFATPSSKGAADVKAQAREFEKQRTDLEPLDMGGPGEKSTDPRVPHAVVPGMGRLTVTTGERK